ncbi:hypothetical protein ACGYLO_12365 [Sulfitobacter sp. 1A13353]|uniref:hypothetical protein n=1 Tax=Sulfitobacter sp. 1A13353 TaxID=3368568 RepID=UPI0037473C16
MLHDLLTAKSFPIYLGRALLVLALIGPLSYCAVEENRSTSQEKIASQQIVADLQAACIAERGAWDNWKETCEFED